MNPTIQLDLKPTTVVIEDVSALTVTHTMFANEPMLGVLVYIDGSEHALPLDPEFPEIIEYLIAPSLLFGEGVVCRVSPLVNSRETRFTFVSPMRLIHKKSTIVIVYPEV